MSPYTNFVSNYFFFSLKMPDYVFERRNLQTQGSSQSNNQFSLVTGLFVRSFGNLIVTQTKFGAILVQNESVKVKLFRFKGVMNLLCFPTTTATRMIPTECFPSTQRAKTHAHKRKTMRVNLTSRDCVMNNQRST